MPQHPCTSTAPRLPPCPPSSPLPPAAAGEELIGARAYRVIFALVSLPLAVAAVVYFIDHRYDGLPLWNLRCALCVLCGWVGRVLCALGVLHSGLTGRCGALNSQGGIAHGAWPGRAQVECTIGCAQMRGAPACLASQLPHSHRCCCCCCLCLCLPPTPVAHRGVPGVHSAVWGLSFLSFYFLYPSTFNILEVGGVGGLAGGFSGWFGWAGCLAAWLPGCFG